MIYPEQQAHLWPYSGRNGEGVEQSLAILLAEPDACITEADQQTVRTFAGQLARGCIDDNLRAETNKTLKEVQANNASVYRINFYYGHLERLNAACITLGIMSVEAASEGGTAQLGQEMRSAVAEDKPLDSRTLRTFAAASKDWYNTQLAERLQASPDNDRMLPDFEHEVVNLKPDILLEKCADLQAYRRFYRSVRRALKTEPPSPLRDAQQTLVDMHWARANNLLAYQYPAVVQLAEQLDASPITPLTEQWRQQIDDVAPAISAAWKVGDLARFRSEFANRMDRVRNGVGLDSVGAISTIYKELEQFADDIEAAGICQEFPELSRVPADITERLEKVHWTAGQLQQFLQTVLDEWELLSEYQSDWHTASERTMAAPDNKWQVIQTAKAESLSVDGTPKVMWVPEKFNRSLLQQTPAGALPVSAHELAHVLQIEYDLTLAEQIPLADIKGRRALTMRELGGIVQESLLQAHFGRSRSTNTTYLRALQRKMVGGNETEVARAFLEARLRTQTPASHTADTKAATRATRLDRHDGFDSQPLDYIEQNYILRRLEQQLDSETIAALTIAGTSFSLPDSAALHRVGLFEVPKSINRHPAEDVLRIFFDRFDTATPTP